MSQIERETRQQCVHLSVKVRAWECISVSLNLYCVWGHWCFISMQTVYVCICVSASVMFSKDAKYNTHNQNIANTKYVTE